MPWFRVSDDLPARSSTSRIPRPYRLRAIGLWAMAGAWSAQQLTDGHVPAWMLDELAGTPEDAEWLVTAGIWEPVEDGWQFVVWDGEQPMREKVLELRAKTTARVQTWRARNSVTNPDANNTRDGVTNAGETLPPVPDPNPNPSTSTEVDVHAKRERPSIDIDFEAWWKLYPRKQARADALKAYRQARKTASAKELLDGLQMYLLSTIGVEKEHIKLAGGWLRAERWTDEPVPITPERDRGARQTPEERARQTLSLGLNRDEQNLALVAQLAAEDGTLPDCGDTNHLWTADGTCARCIARRDPELPDGNDF